MSEEIIRIFEERIQIGNTMQAMKTQYGEFIEEHIFRPMREGALDTFETILPSDIDGIVQTQMMGKMVKRFRSRIDSLIQEGLLAKEQIKQMEVEKEDES